MALATELERFARDNPEQWFRFAEPEMDDAEANYVIEYAPNLTDAIWLYGSGVGNISSQLVNPQHGVMPGFEERLDESTIKMLTVYVHQLGGGE